ncbi:hypothetical protein Bca4012_013231 [Brassica carinata]
MYSFPRRYGRVGHFRTRVGSCYEIFVEEKKEKLAEIKSGLDEAGVLARSLQPSANAGCISKLREYKSDLNQLKKDFKRVSSPDANQSTRGELMDPGMADVHALIRVGYLQFCNNQTLLHAHTKLQGVVMPSTRARKC